MMFGLTVEAEASLHMKVAWAILLQSPPIFLLLNFVIPAPWGKTISYSFGPLLPARICWFFFESPNIFWVCVCWYSRPHHSLPTSNLLLLVLFFLHYVQRAILYPIRMSSNTTPMPVTVVIAAFCFTVFNGYLQAQGLCKFDLLHQMWHRQYQFILGVALFLTGAAINLHSDSTLRRLRSLSPNRRQIPSGGLFEWVSAPHYFGEIVEWTGFCIASNFSLATVAFAAYTAANLIPRGIAHHYWYKTNFATYPLNRKAVIPFIL